MLIVFAQHVDNGDKKFQGVSCLLRIGRAARVVGIKQVSSSFASITFCIIVIIFNLVVSIFTGKQGAVLEELFGSWFLIMYLSSICPTQPILTNTETARLSIHGSHHRTLGKISNNNNEWNDANNNIM